MRDLWLLKTLGALDFDPGRLTDAFEILANQFQKLKLLPQLFLLARKIVFGRLKFKWLVFRRLCRLLHYVDVVAVVLLRRLVRSRVLVLEFFYIVVNALDPICMFYLGWILRFVCFFLV